MGQAQNLDKSLDGLGQPVKIQDGTRYKILTVCLLSPVLRDKTGLNRKGRSKTGKGRSKNRKGCSKTGKDVLKLRKANRMLNEA